MVMSTDIELCLFEDLCVRRICDTQCTCGDGLMILQVWVFFFSRFNGRMRPWPLSIGSCGVCVLLTRSCDLLPRSSAFNSTYLFHTAIRTQSARLNTMCFLLALQLLDAALPLFFFSELLMGVTCWEFKGPKARGMDVCFGLKVNSHQRQGVNLL